MSRRSRSPDRSRKNRSTSRVRESGYQRRPPPPPNDSPARGRPSYRDSSQNRRSHSRGRSSASDRMHVDRPERNNTDLSSNSSYMERKNSDISVSSSSLPLQKPLAPPPPPKTAPAALQPPPPPPTPASAPAPTPLSAPPILPASISAIQIHPPEPKTEPALDNAPQIWNHRVSTIAKLHHHKTEAEKLNDRVHTIENIFSSNRLQRNIPDKKRRDLESLKQKASEEKRKMVAARDELVKADSWPVGGGPSSDVEAERLRKEAEEMKVLVERAKELSDGLERMYELAKKAEEKTTGKDKGKGKEKAVENDENAMDVDVDVDSGKQLEEQKKAQINEMFQMLDTLEARVMDLENEQASHYNEVRSQLESLVDPASEAYRETVVSAGTAGTLENVNKMDGEIREVSDTLATLWRNNENTDEQIKKLTEESTQVQDDMRLIIQRFDGFEKQRREDHETIQALEAAIQLYKEHPPSPPASPFQPEAILPMIEEPVTNAVRAEVRQRGNELRSQLEKTLQERDESLYQAVWDTIVTTGRTVQVVASRLQDPSSL
ncbi:hypothetical protein V5O48_000316 [Marasmius crinis-equi]|uniref:Uncharacterized protein n=1 Tax=Marasmius crinis-equi TaxID=585013 RepID=A0ABR3G1N3_9AGAR